MSENLKKHIGKYIKMDNLDLENILEYFQDVTIKKKENLLAEGQVCKANYFVVKGCLRIFFVNEKGIEQTIDFALENWWLSDYSSFSTQKPSSFYIQAVENTNVMAISAGAYEELLQQYPQLERYFRLIHQRAHAAAQFRIKSLYELSREDIYRHFIKVYPEFVQRIPQYLLASFLGFTPEYLSEIRKKNIS